MDAKALQAERYQIVDDLRNGIKPKRLLNYQSITYEAAIEYAGLDLRKTQWDISKCEVVLDKSAKDFHTDVIPVEFVTHDPYCDHMLQSKTYVMSEKGFIQHPEIHVMEPEEYDEFIQDPFAYLVKSAPRIHSGLEGDSNKVAMTTMKAINCKNERGGQLFNTFNTVADQYGFIWPSEGLAEAPFDFLADILRSFTGITGDIRRSAEKVEAACEAILPMMLKYIEVSGGKIIEIPLHMAPFMREKDFERFWWPTFKKMLDKMSEMGCWAHCFMESDWMRYLDYLQELPKNTKFLFEYGDPKLAKDKLGTDYVISGFYPVTLLKTGTKQQCIDKAKEIMDVLAPGGAYVFQLDKAPISLNSFDPDNWVAVCNFIKEYGVY